MWDLVEPVKSKCSSCKYFKFGSSTEMISYGNTISFNTRQFYKCVRYSIDGPEIKQYDFCGMYEELEGLDYDFIAKQFAKHK